MRIAIEVLACPKCKGSLNIDDNNGLECVECKVIYPSKDGVPFLRKEDGVQYEN